MLIRRNDREEARRLGDIRRSHGHLGKGAAPLAQQDYQIVTAADGQVRNTIPVKISRGDGVISIVRIEDTLRGYGEGPIAVPQQNRHRSAEYIREQYVRV